jgi:putative membrane protein
MHWNGWFMGWMWIFWVVVLVVVVFVIVRLLGTSSGRPKVRGEAAEEILKSRYARGEISKDDYERMLNDLRR